MIDVIKQLKQAKSHKRKQLLLRMRKKNLRFFAKNESTQDIADVIRTTEVQDYEIRMTDEFLDIVESKTGEYCHPPGDLSGQADRLSQPYHSDWYDLVNPIPRGYGGSINGKVISQFSGQLLSECKQEVWQRIMSEKIDLPEMKNGRLHSGPIVFLGVFHGLHIMQALNKLEPSDALIVEPEIESFLLSCYFLDYTELTEKIGSLNLIVGEGLSDRVIDHFFNGSEVTSKVWVRFLKVYNSPEFDKIINRIIVYFNGDEGYVPFERELLGLESQIKNLNKSYRFCHWEPTRIAKDVVVVGSGPSLKDNLDWLRKNRDYLSIVAAHSSAALLNEQGIKVDFQIYMELQHDEIPFFDKDIATVAFINANHPFISELKQPILFVELNKGSAVKFDDFLDCTHPSTLNGAFSFSRLLNPERVFLMGADLGAKDEEGAIHIAGAMNSQLMDGFHENYAHNKWTMAYESNFPESEGKIKTNSFFNGVRFYLEKCIGEYHNKTSIFNLSDGVKIDGAQMARVDDIVFDGEFAQDTVQLIETFRIMTTDDWSLFPISAEQLLLTLKENIMACFQDNFDWSDYTEVLDTKFREAFRKSCVNEERDVRVLIFYPVLRQVLVAWYRYMVYAGSLKEAETLYHKGVAEFKKVLDELDWPEELKLFEKKAKGSDLNVDN